LPFIGFRVSRLCRGTALAAQGGYAPKRFAPEARDSEAHSARPSVALRENIAGAFQNPRSARPAQLIASTEQATTAIEVKVAIVIADFKTKFLFIWNS
jgi:hypothetical protein